MVYDSTYMWLRVVNFVEAGSKMMISRGWGRGGQKGLGSCFFTGDRVSVGEDRKALETSSGNGCATM